MDSFVQVSTKLDIDDNQVVVFGAKKKGKFNTFVVGLQLDIPTLATILEKMKKSFGCGGSIKDIEYDGKMMQSLHLQGDKVGVATHFIETLNVGKIVSKPIV